MAAFIDKVTIKIEAGRGGNGVVDWRREKYEDRGGPAGGDGGDGGNVVFRGNKNVNTLKGFRYKQVIKAETGENGRDQKKHGRSGKDTIVDVPMGTQVFDEAGLVADIVEDGQMEVIGRGGKGGFGNAHFKSSTRRAPKVAERGEPGEEMEVTLELKLLADVGLIGLPNAGKSTLLSVISNAKPEIADYPFTTLTPHLGVVDVGDSSLLVADIPGLIEGASQGKGLGDDFLRHVERTAVLVHLVDAYQDDLKVNYETIIKELKDYKVDLSSKPIIAVLSKIDGLDSELLKDRINELKKVAGTDVIAISSHTKQGVKQLLEKMAEIVQESRNKEVEETAETEGMQVLKVADSDDDWWVEKKAGVWNVYGVKIEKFALRSDPENEWGIRRLRDIMQKMGIMHELLRQGIRPGDIIKIKDIEMTF